MSTPESLTTLDDLIYRLRNYTTEDETRYSITHDICDEAADALERLQVEAERRNATMAEAYEFWAHYSSCNEGYQDDMRNERDAMLAKMNDAMFTDSEDK